MDTTKVQEFFDAETAITHPIHLIGCGAIGSTVCEQLARMGCTNIHIYDFDTVSAHNITNQTFVDTDIDKLKTEACETYMKAINPSITIVRHDAGLEEPYSIYEGFIILAVDDIGLRKKIVEANMGNPEIVGFLDFRMRLTDAQMYMAITAEPKQVTNLLASMDFTHAEAMEATPTSACGVALSVVYTVKAIVSYGMANMVKMYTGNKHHTILTIDMTTLDTMGC